MNNSDERDYAEEETNSRLMREEDIPDNSDEDDESDNQCEGHESFRADKMGETVFCTDNYCKSPIVTNWGEGYSMQ